jgi:hypothetical protein
VFVHWSSLQASLQHSVGIYPSFAILFLMAASLSQQQQLSVAFGNKFLSPALVLLWASFFSVASVHT